MSDIKSGYFAHEMPPVGRKFVAVYADGSGANVYMRSMVSEYKDSHSNVISFDFFLDCQYSYWQTLPDSFKLWFER